MKNIKKICKTELAQELYEDCVEKFELGGDVDVLEDEVAWKKNAEALIAENNVSNERIAQVIIGQKEALHALTLQINAQCRVLERILQKRDGQKSDQWKALRQAKEMTGSKE